MDSELDVMWKEAVLTNFELLWQYLSVEYVSVCTYMWTRILFPSAISYRPPAVILTVWRLTTPIGVVPHC